MLLRSSIRRCVTADCWRSCSVSGAHCGTGVGRPSPSTATMMIRHVSLRVTPCSRGSAEATSTRMCIEDRPVCTIFAETSTMSPTHTGRSKWMLPTYAVTQ